MKFVKAQLRVKTEEHEVLLNRVKVVSDLQIRLVDSPIVASPGPTMTAQSTPELRKPSVLLGGVGFRSAARGVQAVFWSSWADSLRMIRKRNPYVADFITVSKSREAESRGRGGPHVEAAARSREGLLGEGFDGPEWEIWRIFDGERSRSGLLGQQSGATRVVVLGC